MANFDFNPITGKLDLVGGSGGGGPASNSFTTIQPVTGGSLVADSSSDTLTLTSPNSSLTIFGTSITDTLAFDLNLSGTDNRIVRMHGTGALQDSSLEITDSSELTRPSNTTFYIGSDTNPVAQLILGRGASSATQHSVVIRGSQITGTDASGGGLTLTDQGSTGLSIGGGISFQSTGPGVGSGSSANTSLERANVDGNGNWSFMVTNATAGSFFRVLGDGGINAIYTKTDNGYVCIGGANTSVAQLLVVGQSAVDDQVLVVQGSSGGQTANIFEVRDSSAAVVASINNSGSIFAKASLVFEETGAGTDTITIQAPASIAASYTLTLPDTDGASGEFLQTNGSGVLTWAAAGGVSGSGTTNFIPRWTSSTALGDSNLFWNDNGGGDIRLGVNRSTNIEAIIDVAHTGGTVPHILFRQDFANNILEVRTTTVPGGSILTAIQGDGGIWGNQTNSSAGDFRWDSDAQDNLIFADVSADGLFLGLAGATARTDSTVCIHGINSTDIPLSVVANTGASGGTKIMQLVTKTGGTDTYFDDSAYLTTLNVVFTGTASDTNTEGTLRNDSTQKSFRGYIAGVEQMLQGTIATQTSTVSITPSAETTLKGTLVGTVVLPANFWTIGKTIIIETWGEMKLASGDGTETFAYKIKAGSVTLYSETYANLGTLLAGLDSLWRARTVITCRTTGGTGTVFCQTQFFDGEAAGRPVVSTVANTGTSTVDTTASMTLDWLGTITTGAGDPIVTCTNATVEVLN